jgi:hypothetical protein
LAEVVFEGIEKLEQVVADPVAIAAATNAGWDKDAGLFETVQGTSRRRCGDLVPHCGVVGADDGLCGQPKDDFASDEVSARGACLLDKVGKEGIDLRREPLGRFGRACGGVGEHADPVIGPAFTKVDQSGDVTPRVGGEDDAYRGNEERREAPSAEDHVDEAATDATVAVAEGVDGFELGVGDCGLGDGRQVVEVDELDEVIEKRPQAASGGGTKLASAGLRPRPPIQF